MKNLKQHSKDNPFKTPEGYFEGLEDALFSEMKRFNDNKRTGFSLPEGYFNTLENEILSKANPLRAKTVRLNPYKKWYYMAGSVAACFVIFFIIKNTLPSTSINTIEVTEIEQMIDDGYIAVNSYELLSVYSDESLEGLSLIQEPVSDSELIEYLHENLENYNQIPLEN